MTSPWRGGHGAPRILAHRGASLEAPENTHAAFELARRQGADGLELDIHLTADGVPVVLHDPTLDRTAGLARDVCTLSVAEVRRLEVGSWFDPRFKGEPIPTLEEVCERYGRDLYLDIEVKADDGTPPDRLVAAVLDVVARTGVRDRALLSSFDPFLVGLAREADPALATGVIVAGLLEPEDLAFVADVSTALFLEAEHVTTATLDAVHAAGLGAYLWTVNDPARAQALRALGADGVITDVPSFIER